MVVRTLLKAGGLVTAGCGATFAAVHFATVTDAATANRQDHPLSPPNLFSRQLVTLFVTSGGRLWNALFADVRVIGYDTFRSQWRYRDPAKGLLTVSNHASTVDEPLVVPCALLSVRECLSTTALMWSATAADVMYTSRALSWLSSSAQAIPVIRGGGVQQRGLDVLVRKLEGGSWVNYYPEGRVFQNADGSLGPLRPGVTRLVCEPKVTPIVLPIISDGLDKVMPLEGLLPGFFKRIRVRIGDPIDLGPLIRGMRERGVSEDQVRAEVGRIIDDAMRIEQRLLRAAVLAEPVPWWERKNQ